MTHSERAYLALIEKIVNTGERKPDRTGVGTLSLFGEKLEFDLETEGFPLLTTKKVFWKGVVEELMWFLHGDTNASHLSARGVKIWEANGSREFLDARNLAHREENDLGPVYGFQWRHWGAEYTTMHDDYTNKGIDQIANLVYNLKTDPHSRRHIVTAWNVSDLDQMVLPPCHMMVQFYVDASGKKLSCQMYQRSADMGLGVPFNIASYALLLCLVANACGMTPKKLVLVFGDCHVYTTHVDALVNVQLKRDPRPFPQLVIKKQIDDTLTDITSADVEVKNYDPHPAVSLPMAV